MPVQGKKIQQITVDYILSKISEYDIYRYYLGRDFGIGVATYSPFHKDESPSFSIVCTKLGKLHHNDFADSTKKGGCIDFVMQLFNLDFKDTLKKIAKDFCLGGEQWTDNASTYVVSKHIPKMDRRSAQITVVSKPFDTADLAYWNDYTISREDLKTNNVYSVKKLYLDGRRFPLKDTELVFGYLEEDRWKIYRPFADRKLGKWMTNIPNNLISGISKIKPGTKIALITKAKKDEMILSKIISSTCSTQNESEFSIIPANVKLIQDNSEVAYINFDSDKTGVQASKYYNQFGFRWINCPNGYTKPDGLPIKDFADLVRYKGMDEVINYFKSKKLI